MFELIGMQVDLTDKSLKQVLQSGFKKITDVDGVIISDYDKGICTESINKRYY